MKRDLPPSRTETARLEQLLLLIVVLVITLGSIATVARHAYLVAHETFSRVNAVLVQELPRGL